MSYVVRYIRRTVKERTMITETTPVDDLDMVVELAMARLRELRYHLTPPPDGFIVVDEDGAEKRRWIEPRKP